MRIIVDAFGGDNAPLSVLEGAALARQEIKAQIVLVGDTEKIHAVAEKYHISLEGIELFHAPDVIPMEADPMKMRTDYKNCSMAVACRMLADGSGDALVTAGSTGAAVTGATIFVKRLRGVVRCAIATLVPNQRGAYLLIDSGANAACRADMLRSFAVMGSIYMNKVEGIQNPRVGLVNIGTEETKGGELQLETHKLLKETQHIHYIGSVEAREVPLGGCDVAVCDGFTGNVMLKLTEGLAKMFNGELKKMFSASFKSKLGAALLMDEIKVFKKKFDASEQGGALMLGAKKPVIKAHGNSDARAIKNAIRQAVSCVEKNIVGEIESVLEQLASDGNNG